MPWRANTAPIEIARAFRRVGEKSQVMQAVSIRFFNALWKGAETTGTSASQGFRMASQTTRDASAPPNRALLESVSEVLNRMGIPFGRKV